MCSFDVCTPFLAPRNTDLVLKKKLLEFAPKESHYIFDGQYYE